MMIAVIFTFTLMLQSSLGQWSGRAPANCVTQSGKDCVFPFIYKEVEYYQCTYTDSPTPWCATDIDPAGVVVTNRWEDCSLPGCPAEEAPACLTVGGRVDHSHWSRALQILCSHWLGSRCCCASSLMP